MKYILPVYEKPKKKRPPAVYDNVVSYYGISDEQHERKLSGNREKNGINSTYKIR